MSRNVCACYLKKSSPHWTKSNKAWYSWDLTGPNTMLAFEICKTYLKMILKVWEESVSNIFNTLFHKLNETFRGCIIANIWASQLHFIFQRYIFPDSQLWLYFIIILVCEWIFVLKDICFVHGIFYDHSSNYFLLPKCCLRSEFCLLQWTKRFTSLIVEFILSRFLAIKMNATLVFGHKNILSPFRGRSYIT